MFYFTVGLVFQVLGFWVWSFICGPANKKLNKPCWDCHHQPMVCLHCSSDLVPSTTALSKGAESCASLYEVQTEHTTLLEGTTTLCCNHSKHTFVREVRFRRNSTLFLIRAKINQFCRRPLRSGENGELAEFWKLLKSRTFPLVPEQELISFRDLVLPLKNTFFYGRTAVVASVVMIWVKSLVTEREALKKAKD